MVMVDRRIDVSFSTSVGYLSITGLLIAVLCKQRRDEKASVFLIIKNSTRFREIQASQLNDVFDLWRRLTIIIFNKCHPLFEDEYFGSSERIIFNSSLQNT